MIEALEVRVESYQKRGDGAKEKGTKSAKISIRNESSGECSNVGGTIPYIHHIYHKQTTQIVLCGQVHRHVSYQAHGSQLLKRLIP